MLKRDGRYIYYLITKVKYYHKPTYQSLQASLTSMKDHCVSNGVSCVSMPRIGCGLDRLDWSKVAEIITSVFAGTDIKISVYSI